MSGNSKLPVTFERVLARVREEAQRGRIAHAIADIDRARPALPGERDKLLLLRLDVARASTRALDVAESLRLIDDAARAAPDSAAARLASSLRLRGLLDEAHALLGKIPPHRALAVEAYHLGLDFARRNQVSQAGLCYEYALACDADLLEAHVNLGGILLAARRFRKAQPHFATVAQRQPQNAAAWLGFGQCLLHTGQGESALAAFAHLDENAAAAPQLLAWRATATAQCGDEVRALDLYQQALARDPRNFDAWFGRAQIFERRNDLVAAAPAYAQAWALQPQSNWALGCLVFALARMADWPRWQTPNAELIERLRRGDVGDYATSLSSLDLDGIALRRVAEQCLRTQSALKVTPIRKRDFGVRAPGRIRLGYVSSDFRDHATSRLLVEVLEHHDRDRFELFGFALNRADDSALGERVAAAFEHFIEAADLPAEAVAAHVLERRIDILIDLNGHTKGACMGLAALRPAPIIVNYLGYPGTMGDDVDYLIADRHVAPNGSEAEFNEALVRLPHCYQANDRRRAVGAATTRAQQGLPESAILACSFNQAWKFTPSIWAVWMRLMHAHSRLHLWLLDENDGMRENLRQRAREAGIDPGRLTFAPRVAQADHLARLALADLAFDTAPCNSHTTGSDALWMGVPMVSPLGNNFAGRVGASLLHAVGLPELVARDEADYATKLDALIAHPKELTRLKSWLLDRGRQSPLFDSAATARALDAGYLAMHARRMAGLPPAAIDIPP
ncbi:MAG: tetratricopeptide repeat protein [Proteobacteria bacterium]|nr:tetratricopeptide repeat protein [Pseudomonadota bacterium]